MVLALAGATDMEVPALEVTAVNPVILAHYLTEVGYRGVAWWAWQVGECSFYPGLLRHSPVTCDPTRSTRSSMVSPGISLSGLPW